MRLSPLILALVLALPVSVLAFDGFVGCSTSDDCYPFDLFTYTAGAAVDLLPEGNYPYDATITPDDGEVWFVGSSGDGMVVIDRASQAVTQRFAVANYLIGVAFNLDGSRALVTSRDDEVIKIIDTASYSEVGSLPFPTDYQGAGNIALDPQSGKFYVVDWYNDNLVEVAADGSEILRTRDFGNSLWQVVVAHDGQHVYVTDRGLDVVVEISTDTFMMTRTFSVGDDPWGLDITADDNLLVVSCEDSHEVYLIDLVGGGTTPIALDATADARDVDILDSEGVAFITGGTVTGYTAAVYVIDLETAMIVDTFDGPGSNSNVVAVQAQMAGETTPVESTPAAMATLGAYPNPFNPQVNIELALAADTHGTLTVHDLAGRRVRTLASGSFAAGNQTFRWDGRGESGENLASGVYLVRLRSDAADLLHKVVLVQ